MKLDAPVLLCAVLALQCGYAHSQTSKSPQTFIASGMDASDDSDGFHEFKPWISYEAANGWGLRAGWQHYAIDAWSSTGHSIYLTHRVQKQSWSSNAHIGLNQTGRHNHFLGMWDAMYQFTPHTAAGWSLEKDVVNSQRSLERGLASTTALAVLDHQFHERLSVGLSVGSTWFTDHNRRDLLRSRWTVTLSEDQGLYAYLITRHYQNSRPYQGAYFAPW